MASVVRWADEGGPTLFQEGDRLSAFGLPEYDLADELGIQGVVKPLPPLPPVHVQLLAPRGRGDLHVEGRPLQPSRVGDAVNVGPGQGRPRLNHSGFVYLVLYTELVKDLLQNFAERTGVVLSRHMDARQGGKDRGELPRVRENTDTPRACAARVDPKGVTFVACEAASSYGC